MERLTELVQEGIVDRWTSVAEKAASARGLSRPELTKVMPGYLAALAAGEPLSSLRAKFESHLADRIRLGFDLAEMIEEFAILERCIAQALDDLPHDQRPSQEERDRLFSALQDTIVAASEVYQKHMRLDEQRQKRYLRRLGAIADDALRDAAAPLHTRLREVLELVLEVTGADAAAILLYDAHEERLITKASAGIAGEELDRYTSSLSLASFAGQIAAHEHPVSVADAATTELEVSEPLRRSGIHSLLGVRLPRRVQLVGVMYVGLRERRPFTGHEIGQIEMLGDHLSLRLDHARLYESLRRRIADLGVERQLREQFVAVLAHDLRGPLSASRLHAQIVVKHPERANRSAGRVLQQIDRAERMIHDLLDVHRVSAGSPLPLEIEACDLRDLAQGVIEELGAVHADRFDLVAGEAAPGHWSPEHLYRALWNLGVNADKYGAPGTRIAIRVERFPGGARMSVHNSGDPIAPEEQARVFDLFAQSKAGAQRRAGWGLGLAFVRACAEAHGGTAEVESSAESGTTFSVTLPLDSRPYQGNR
jgi:signal transduction histidine kinase